jgi:cation diffusion facilitator family transporter
MAGVVTSPAESQEILALRLSLLLVILFAAGAVLVAMYSDSETMSLEAMSAVVDIVVSSLAVFVARKVRAPANHRYQFGYAKYEPLMTTVEGVLMAGVCTAAILYSVRDLLHPDPVHDAWFVVAYSAASFVISVIFGLWMRRVGKQEGSQLARAEGELWIAEGWLALGVCAAFVVSIALSRIWKLDASAYVDPAVCIVLSLILLKKPFDILRDSISDLVDANPYAEAINALEAAARAVAERFHLKGVEWVRVRKAGRRVFVMVSFFEDPGESLQGMDQVRQAVIDDVVRLDLDADVVVVFRPAPAAAEAPDPGQPPPAVAAT